MTDVLLVDPPEDLGGLMGDDKQAVLGGSFAEILVVQSPDALSTLSPDGKVLFWSRGATRLFGYSSEEAVGRPWEDLAIPADRRKGRAP